MDKLMKDLQHIMQYTQDAATRASKIETQGDANDVLELLECIEDYLTSAREQLEGED